MGFFEEMPEMATLIEKLGSFFDKDRIEAEAREAKFIQRPRKLTGVAFLGVCVMQSFGQSLSMLCGMLGEFSIELTPKNWTVN
jgi:hypothetical protein